MIRRDSICAERKRTMADIEKAKDVFEVFKNYLTAKDIHFEADDSSLMIRLVVQGEDLPQPTFIRVMPEKEVVMISSPIPSNIPEEKRMDAAIAVVSANYGMINGCFDLDMSDGEIHYRCAQGYMGTDFSDELAAYMLQMVFLITDEFNDKFFLLGKGLLSLEDFLEKTKRS